MFGSRLNWNMIWKQCALRSDECRSGIGNNSAWGFGILTNSATNATRIGILTNSDTGTKEDLG
jgi:hypothetical protein